MNNALKSKNFERQTWGESIPAGSNIRTDTDVRKNENNLRANRLSNLIEALGDKEDWESKLQEKPVIKPRRPEIKRIGFNFRAIDKME